MTRFASLYLRLYLTLLTHIYSKNRTPLTPPQIFQDVSADHAFKTVTIEGFPHSASLQAASVHPCKHASVMKKVIERMNAGVVEEQKAAQRVDGAILWASVLEVIEKIRLGAEAVNCAEA